MNSVWVYRCFDAEGGLLYIGMTRKPRAREQGHRHSSPWWADVANVTYTEYPSREAARVAEYDAILAENPLHNKARRQPRVSFYERQLASQDTGGSVA